jgi:hypothetical protein
MTCLFPHAALLACINEGRAPRPSEIESVAARIWREACTGKFGPRSWNEVPRGSLIYHRTMALACAALGCAYRPDELRSVA